MYLSVVGGSGRISPGARRFDPSQVHESCLLLKQDCKDSLLSEKVAV